MMNSYNNLVRAPTVIQPVPIGQDEVVTFDTPPAVEYASHFRTIEELEEYYESLKYVPIQRPSENFIFTEAADNYHFSKDACPFCTRFFPSEMNAMDRGRHAFKICPYRPVRCQVTSKVMLAKDYLYLHMFTLNEQSLNDNRPGIWAWSNAVKRDRDMRREAEERAIRAETLAMQKQMELEELARLTLGKQFDAEQSVRETQKRLQEGGLVMAANTREFEITVRREREAARDAELRATAALENAKAWETAAEAVARREKQALLEAEKRGAQREMESETERLQEREARLRALERAKEIEEQIRAERVARQQAEERAQRALEHATVWEEATDLLVKREQALLQDAEAARQEALRRASEADRALQGERQAREAAENRARQAEEHLTRWRADSRGGGGALRRAEETAAQTQLELHRERTARREAELLAAELDAKQRWERRGRRGSQGPREDVRQEVVEYRRANRTEDSPFRPGRRSRSPDEYLSGPRF